MASKDSLINRFLMLEEISHEEAIYTLNMIVALLVYAENATVSIIKKWYKQFAKNGIITVKDVQGVLTKSELNKFKSLLARYIEESRRYELEREYKEELEEAIKSNKIDRLKMLKIYVKHNYYIAYKQIYNQLNAMVKKVYSEGYYSTIYEIQRHRGMWQQISEIDEMILSHLMYITWSDDKYNIVNRIKRFRKSQINSVIDVITKAIEFERPLEDTLFKISQISHNNKIKMGRMTRTEQAFYNSLAQKQAYIISCIDAYQIIAVIDDRTSDICRKLNGKRYKMKDYEISVTAPPFHPNCRSTTRPYISKDLISNIKSPDMEYSEWKKKYTK